VYVVHSLYWANTQDLNWGQCIVNTVVYLEEGNYLPSGRIMDVITEQTVEGQTQHLKSCGLLLRDSVQCPRFEAQCW
jgi:hypothetical protein